MANSLAAWLTSCRANLLTGQTCRTSDTSDEYNFSGVDAGDWLLTIDAVKLSSYLEGEEDVVISDDGVDTGNDVEDAADDDDNGGGDCDDDTNDTFAASNVPGESVESGDEVVTTCSVSNGERKDSLVAADETTRAPGDDVISSDCLVDCGTFSPVTPDDTVTLGDKEMERVSSTSTSLLPLSDAEDNDDDTIDVLLVVSVDTCSPSELSSE